MKNNLDVVLTKITAAFEKDISENSRFYREVNIGNEAQKFGFSDIEEAYRNAVVIVPLKQPTAGMKVRIDGRTFKNYGQFETGIAVPGYVAKASALPYKRYVPDDSMILNFA